MIKSLITGIALVGLLGAPNFADANDGSPDGKLYVEVGGTWSQPSDADAEFTTQNTNASWDLSDMKGIKVQVGSDFGKFRIDAKFQYLEGDVDGISGGVTVLEVDPRSASAEAGIIPGDVITLIGSKPIRGTSSFEKVVKSLQPGKSVPIRLIRRGSHMFIGIKIP